jgi:tetratricopeptide (TPR) repeat protein
VSGPRAGEDSGRVRGVTEALDVLEARPRATRPPLEGFTRALLARHVDGGAWNAAGLPPLPRPTGQPVGDPVPLHAMAVVRLAQLTVSMHCTGLSLADRPAVWARLESFFARRLPESDPVLIRLRIVVCHQRLEAGCQPPNVAGLRRLLDLQRQVHGVNAYLTGLTRAHLATAYRQAGDYTRAASLLEQETRVRTDLYGPEHPVTLVTRSMLTRVLLTQADITKDAQARSELARHALAVITGVRITRDQLFGATSANATRSRRYEAHALLLLGDLDRARAGLEHILTFDATRDGQKDLYAIGQTHLLLARVHAAQGDRPQALAHAEQARRILSAQAPDGESASRAREIVATLAAG